MLRLLTISLATALTLAAAAPPARAEDTAVAASRVDAVTVYEDRALVTRTADVTLSEGTTRVAVEHLPAGLDGPSLRARCDGAQVLGVEIEAVHLEEENSRAVREAEETLRSAQHELRDAEGASEDAAQRWHVLQTISAKAASDASRTLGGAGGMDVGALEKVLDFVEQRTAKARRDMAAAADRVETVQRTVQTAERRLAELRGAGAREERRAVVTLRSGSAGERTLSLSYLIRGAAWRPVYALRVDEDFGRARLELGAEVQQSTGEDWGDVQLELTTARPSAGAAPPTPEPWRIGLPQPASSGTVAGRAAPRAARKLEVADSMVRDKEQLEIEVVRSGLVVAFGAHRRETVRAGARPARVALGTFDLEPDVVWTAFPRATDDVFVQARIVNTTGTALPAGEARVFVGPDYVGPLRLADWGIDEDVRVGLGVDRQVAVEREELERRRETEGLFSKETVHVRRYRITVKNHRGREISLRLLDQLPVSGDEDLEVELTESSLPQAKLPEREAEDHRARGVLEWHRDVPAGGELDLRFGFEIRHPEDTTPWGLD